MVLLAGQRFVGAISQFSLGANISDYLNSLNDGRNIPVLFL